MVTGSLQIKNGTYYAVLSYTDENGKWKQKWKTTKLKEKGNKRRAQETLDRFKADFEEELNQKNQTVSSDAKTDILFSDFLQQWLKIARTTIEESTYMSYVYFSNHICDYFGEKKIKLAELQAAQIQEYYQMLGETRTANTVIHYHAVIRKCLQYAVKTDLIPSNPADKIERPKKAHFQASFYNSEEMNRLLEACKGDPLELPINVAAYYGLRRSEVVGLKWDAVDFEAKTITIGHKVLELRVDGKAKMIKQDRLKTASSHRTLPLVPHIETMLLKVRKQQEEDRAVCKKSYSKDGEGYICRQRTGELLHPNYITQHFKILLRNKGLRVIRFHDLRHSCASLLLSAGVPMKQIQEWLGHSDFNTTANIYSHLEYASKVQSAQAIAGIIEGKRTSE